MSVVKAYLEVPNLHRFSFTWQVMAVLSLLQISQKRLLFSLSREFLFIKREDRFV